MEVFPSANPHPKAPSMSVQPPLKWGHSIPSKSGVGSGFLSKATMIVGTDKFSIQLPMWTGEDGPIPAGL